MCNFVALDCSLIPVWSPLARISGSFLAYMHYGNFFVINLCDTYYSSDRSSLTACFQLS